jgi:hypothetical protein
MPGALPRIECFARQISLRNAPGANERMRDRRVRAVPERDVRSGAGPAHCQLSRGRLARVWTWRGRENASREVRYSCRAGTLPWVLRLRLAPQSAAQPVDERNVDPMRKGGQAIDELSLGVPSSAVTGRGVAMYSASWCMPRRVFHLSDPGGPNASLRADKSACPQGLPLVPVGAASSLGLVSGPRCTTPCCRTDTYVVQRLVASSGVDRMPSFGE